MAESLDPQRHEKVSKLEAQSNDRTTMHRIIAKCLGRNWSDRTENATSTWACRCGPECSRQQRLGLPPQRIFLRNCITKQVWKTLSVEWDDENFVANFLTT